MKFPITTILYCTVLTVVLFACKKNHNWIGGGSCSESYNWYSKPLPDSLIKINDTYNCMFLPESISLNEYAYSTPIVNPKNNFEIAFIRASTTSPVSLGQDLCVFNFCTNTLKVIATNVAYSLDWSVKGWIIYTGDDYQLWKVKSNGDSLTQLTNTGDFNNDARWSLDGTKYIYQDASLGAAKMRVSDENGNSLGIYDIWMQKCDWINDSEMIFSTYNQLHVYNLQSLTSSSVSPLMNNVGVSMISVVDDKAYFEGDDGLYIMDLLNGYQISKVDSNYNTFLGGYIQPIGTDRLLIDRRYQDTIAWASCTTYVDRYLTLFDLNTKMERRIIIPE